MRKIDRASRVPPWQQIANVLRAEIEDGKYSPDGPALPSVTRLSQEWDVARRTANKALHALAEEGLVEVVQGMGYYVRLPLYVLNASWEVPRLAHNVYHRRVTTSGNRRAAPSRW